MNHLQFQVSIGAIGITWNSLGKLSRLDWYDCQMPLWVQNSEKNTTWSLLSRCGLPRGIETLMQGLKGYFDEGNPLPAVDWDLIDQTQWSDFQKQVYQTISLIPHGETRTYSWVAARIKNKQATRAVGQALRRNPLPVIVPCHRIVGNKAIGGFMGKEDPHSAEIVLKQKLLSLEDRFLNPTFSFAPIEWIVQHSPNPSGRFVSAYT